jgi:DNA-directed RNA polymerase specialized sigma24 family protein
VIPTTESVTILARRWAAGDRRAGSKLITKHDDWIRRCARRVTMRWEDEDDVAQIMRIAFVEASLKIESAGSNVKAPAFLRTSMKNAFWETIKKRPIEVDEDHIDEAVSIPCDETVAKCELSMIARAAQLDDATGDLLMNRFGHGLTDVDHGAQLGVSYASIARRSVAAMKRVRETIGIAEVYVRPKPSVEGDERRVLDYLRRNGPSLGRDICAALDLKQYSFWFATNRLREIGAIVTSGENRSKRYMLTSQQSCAA